MIARAAVIHYEAGLDKLTHAAANAEYGQSGNGGDLNWGRGLLAAPGARTLQKPSSSHQDLYTPRGASYRSFLLRYQS